MEWQKLSRKKAENLFQQAENGTPFEVDITQLSESYQKLREIIEFKWLENSDLESEKPRVSEYYRDLAIATSIYEYMQNEMRMTARFASDNDVWRYIIFYVVPDLTQKRWGLSKDRFYDGSSRIWLKALYWYIHLSWQGNIDQTIEVLKQNTTDEIVQLVERTGPSGYRIELSREIMKKYNEVVLNGYKSKDLFRKIMKLNTALTRVIEPYLVVGGVSAYANRLFSRFLP